MLPDSLIQDVLGDANLLRGHLLTVEQERRALLALRAERDARRRLYNAALAYATRYGRSTAERDDLNEALTAAAALDAPPQEG